METQDLVEAVSPPIFPITQVGALAARKALKVVLKAQVNTSPTVALPTELDLNANPRNLWMLIVESRKHAL